MNKNMNNVCNNFLSKIENSQLEYYNKSFYTSITIDLALNLEESLFLKIFTADYEKTQKNLCAHNLLSYKGEWLAYIHSKIEHKKLNLSFLEHCVSNLYSQYEIHQVHYLLELNYKENKDMYKKRKKDFWDFRTVFTDQAFSLFLAVECNEAKSFWFSSTQKALSEKWLNVLVVKTSEGKKIGLKDLVELSHTLDVDDVSAIRKKKLGEFLVF